MNPSELIHLPDQQQFRLKVQGETCFVNYRMNNNLMYLTHSEVPHALRGQGAGKELVEKTFEFIEAHDIKAVAVCSYIRAVAMRSPKWSQIIG